MKQCLNRCNGVGVCEFKSSTTDAAVDRCLISSSDCLAQCRCSSGRFGSACELSREEFQARQSSRGRLIDSLKDIVNSQDADSNSLSSWSKSLAAISKSPSELSTETAQTAVSICESVLSNAVSLSGLDAAVVVSSVADMSVAVDNIISSVVYTRKSKGKLDDEDRRSLLSATSNDTEAALVDSISTMTSLFASSLVYGQKALDTVRSNYRVSSQAILGWDGASMSVPQTAIEAASKVSTSSVLLSPVASLTGDQMSVSVISIKANLFSETNTANITATPLRLQLQLDDVCASRDPSNNNNTYDAVFKMKHFSAHPMNHQSTLATTGNITTVCKVGEPFDRVIACESGVNITVVCDGTSNYVVNASCPYSVTVPSCVVEYTTFPSIRCEVVNYTADYTTCGCLFCNSTEESGRRLTVQSQTLQLVTNSIITSVTLFVHTLYSFDSLSTPAAIYSSLKILETFLFICINCQHVSKTQH